ncbi:amidohydrolase [bacterium]|nr:amidohydrolase [bacterium]
MKNLKLSGGRVYGGSEWNPPEWHDSILIRNGIIDGIDSIDDSMTSFETISLDNSILFPGLCDAHIHLVVGGISLNIPDLEGLDLNGVIDALTNYCSENIKHDWVKAFNWQPWLCKLDAKTLDKAIPNRPVIVYNLDLHSCCCNSTALKRIGLGNDSLGFSSDIVECDGNGKPTGILKEDALQLFHDVIPAPSSDETKEAILTAQDYLLSLGITAVSEVLQPNSEIVYRQLDDEGKLKLDVDAWLRIDDWKPEMLPVDYGRRFRINTVKVFLDGSLGSRTAAMCEPYNDKPHLSGILNYTDDELIELLTPVTKSGWRLAVHAIGDCAIKQFCRIIEKLPHVDGINHRIEHVQVLPVEGVDILVKSGAGASIQPIHLIDDQRWLKESIGADRCKRNAVWQSLFNAGITLAIGSDWPVASPDPRLNIHCAINRCGFNGKPHECSLLSEALTPNTAIRAASYGWAAAAGLQKHRGSITVGQKADLTVVSGVSEDLKDWSGTKIEMTICNGEIVYRS